RQRDRDGTQSLELSGRIRDRDGVAWGVLLRATLPPAVGRLQLHYEWRVERERKVKALWGPNLNVAESRAGDAKRWGLFPGLEFLNGPEPSSNPRDFASNLADRRSPHPYKITIPLMAITVGSTHSRAPARAGRFFTPDSLKDWEQAPPAEPDPEITTALLWDAAQKWDG